MSTATQTFIAAVCRRLQMFAPRIGRPSAAHPEYCGVSSERVDAADAVNGRFNTPDALEAVEAAQPWLPIGPSCC